MSSDRPYDQRPSARPSEPDSARAAAGQPQSKQPSCLLVVGIFVLVVALGGLAIFGFSNLAKGEPFLGSQEPDVRQQVREAADDYFGKSNVNSIYVTGASRVCKDLEAGMTAEASLADADPLTAAFYTEIAVPIMCPEYR